MFVLQSVLAAVCFFIHNAMQTVIIFLLSWMHGNHSFIQYASIGNLHRCCNGQRSCLDCGSMDFTPGPSKPTTMKLVFVASALGAQD